MPLVVQNTEQAVQNRNAGATLQMNINQAFFWAKCIIKQMAWQVYHILLKKNILQGMWNDAMCEESQDKI